MARKLSRLSVMRNARGEAYSRSLEVMNVLWAPTYEWSQLKASYSQEKIKIEKKKMSLLP